MSGDYTRFGFKPRKRFAGVLMQQGRVQLDSDWNEEIDIERERLRLLSLDNFGRLGVPYLTAPNSFRLGLIAGPPTNLSIEPGRLYVDGRLAELFPGEAATYLSQPFLPNPPPLPAGDALAYLDVWEREVTYIEDPDLLDPALGGADTATRLQTVWQVRVDGVADAACGLPVGPPPSAGRLTTRAIAPPAPDDPCILPPVAGYRGLENRLYRIEVQRGGALGVARFKWSRDNGSLVAVVSAVAVAGTQTTLTVNRIGRDQVMRFRVGDWVTVTDDHRELWGEPGEMALIVDIVEADRHIVLDRALPSAGGRAFGAAAADIAARHTRVQRWDQTASLNTLDADGLMTTGAGPLNLDAGIQVSFSTDPAGGEFRVGDYWVFWARTATARIEELTAAPPRGIQHHYVQLAAVSGLGGAAPAIEDCRPPPPAAGEGCCSFVVRPGESIQAAIDALPPAGGCVCLKTGMHAIDEPIRIVRDNVTLHGESRGAIVLSRRGPTLLIIAGGNHVRVHTLVFRQQEASQGPVVVIQRAEDVTVDDCRLEAIARGDSIGMLAVTCSALTISDCDLAGAVLGAWFDEGCENVTVRGCEFTIGRGENIAASAAILARTMRGPVIVDSNVVLAPAHGVLINDNPGGRPASRAEASRVTHNHIRLTGGRALPQRVFGIDVAAESSLVSGNRIEHGGGQVTAIRLCGDGSIASANLIRAGGETAAAAFGIAAGFDEDGIFVPLERLVIVDNVVEGPQHGVVLLGTARSRVSGNLMGQGTTSFGFGVAMSRAADCLIADNVMSRALLGVFAVGGARNTISDNRVDGGGTGVAAGNEEAPTIRGNRLTGLAQGGILVVNAAQRCNVIENRIVRCGSAAEVAVGVNATNVNGELHVEANEVMDVGLAPAPGAPVAPLAYGVSGQGILEARIESNIVTYSDMNLRSLAGEDRALRLRGALETVIILADRRVVFGFAAQIANNRFIGPGASALVEVLQQPITDTIIARFERLLFNGNYCAHFTGPPRDNGATVSLVGRHCSITGNQVKATTQGYFSWDLHGMPGPFIANVSDAGHSRRPAQMPNPEAAFNTIA